MHLRVRSVKAPQHAVDIKIDEKQGCTITLAGAPAATSAPPTALPAPPTFQHGAAPPPFQLDHSRALSAQMAELLHVPAPTVPQPLNFGSHYP